MTLARQGASGVELESRAEGVCAFVRRYVEAAPDVLEDIERSAGEAGVGDEVAGVIAAAKAYFEEAGDFIPDHTGIAGLVDDAYLALRLVERFSSEVRRLSHGVGGAEGEGLLSLPLAAANSAVRAMIGEPLAGQLDSAVEGVLSMAGVRDSAGRLAERGVRLRLSDPFGEDGVTGSMGGGV